MKLAGKQLKYLRGLAHHLKPVVAVGIAGATPAVTLELDDALTAHELIKIRLPALERVQKQQLLDSWCLEAGATLVQLIGRTGVLYRPAPTPRIQLA